MSFPGYLEYGQLLGGFPPQFQSELDPERKRPFLCLQEICIEKAPGEKLGISIRGGAKGHAGNPFDPTDEGIFISKVPDP